MVKTLEDLRKEINQLDKNMAMLYEDRMKLVQDIAELKKLKKMPIADIEREKAVIEQNKNYIENEELKPLYEEFIQFIMDQAKDLEHTKNQG